MNRFLIVIEKASGNYSAYSPALPAAWRLAGLAIKRRSTCMRLLTCRCGA